MSAETNILRHELAEARRKLDAERVNTDNAYIKLAKTLRLLDDMIELADGAMKSANRDGAEYDRDAELKDARAFLAAHGGKK